MMRRREEEDNLGVRPRNSSPLNMHDTFPHLAESLGSMGSTVLLDEPVEVSTGHARNGLGCGPNRKLHLAVGQWNSGKWQHGPKPAVPWWFNFDPHPLHSRLSVKTRRGAKVHLWKSIESKPGTKMVYPEPCFKN